MLWTFFTGAAQCAHEIQGLFLGAIGKMWTTQIALDCNSEKRQIPLVYLPEDENPRMRGMFYARGGIHTNARKTFEKEEDRDNA